MRIFLAGATGVIGVRLVPLMLAAGHQVAAMTRTPGKIAGLRATGATAVLCNVFDKDLLIAAVKSFRPDVIMHQLTDLPDDITKIAEYGHANERIRTEGTRNLVAAAHSAATSGFVAQSIAWGGGSVIEAHENAVIAAGGTVLRYGQFYGPGTYYENEPPPPPMVHVDVAARRTISFLAGPPGIISITADDPVAGAGKTSSGLQGRMD